MDQMTERPARAFHVGEILTVATGTFVSPTGMGGVYNLLRHITGEDHMTHQLLRAIRELEPYLRERFPWINSVTFPRITNEAEGRAFLAAVAAEHGEYHEVPPLPFGAYVGREPIAEFREKNPNVQIIGVEID